MPILSAELLSNYYAITLNNKTYILDSWNENLQQDVNDKSFIQGDIANRIIDVNNPLHQATMSGPILLLKDLDAELKTVDNSYYRLTIFYRQWIYIIKFFGCYVNSYVD